MKQKKICIGHALRIVIGIALLILLIPGGINARTIINSCSTISSPGEYVLNQSIMDSSASSCINITSSDVIFDGASYTIDGVGAQNTYGVYVISMTNVTVKNLTVMDWHFGVYYSNVQNGIIAYNTASNNYIGIVIDYSNNNNLTHNIASNNNNGFFLGISSNK